LHADAFGPDGQLLYSGGTERIARGDNDLFVVLAQYIPEFGDACEAATARGADILILDTAGRLHTKKDLMKQLTKIRDVVARKIPGAPNEVLLVLDATTGQNAIVQAKMFTETINDTGIFLAKLDGTARGGIVIAIKDQLDIPVKFVGLGEKPEDIAEFDPNTFVEALFD